jgi:hypothetical protein
MDGDTPTNVEADHPAATPATAATAATTATAATAAATKLGLKVEKEPAKRSRKKYVVSPTAERSLMSSMVGNNEDHSLGSESNEIVT